MCNTFEPFAAYNVRLVWWVVLRRRDRDFNVRSRERCVSRGGPNPRAMRPTKRVRIIIRPRNFFSANSRPPRISPIGSRPSPGRQYARSRIPTKPSSPRTNTPPGRRLTPASVFFIAVFRACGSKIRSPHAARRKHTHTHTLACNNRNSNKNDLEKPSEYTNRRGSFEGTAPPLLVNVATPPVPRNPPTPRRDARTLGYATAPVYNGREFRADLNNRTDSVVIY